ncbi:MAG: DUF3291 domain-containing protein [Xenococcaceae cyanobacterium]
MANWTGLNTKFWLIREFDNLELFRAKAIHYNYARHSHPGYSIGIIESGVGGNYYQGTTDIRAYPNPKMLVNVSVWQSIEQLKVYVYKSLHGDFFVRRRQWFEKYRGEHFAMWWIRSGYLPTVEEGKAKLEYLELHGDSPQSFTFAQPYPSPND